MEFILMLGLAVILMIAFLAALNAIMAQENAKIKEELFIDLGTYVQREIILADTREGGFTRTFAVPPGDLNGSFSHYAYSISINTSTLTIIAGQDHYTFPVPLVNGQVIIGENTIIHENDTLKLNPQ